MSNNDTKDNYLYTNSFSWFTGVIEDILDPKEMGRVRVRCFGYHTERKDYIPTTSLPWAHVMLPVTSASTSGVGESPTGLVRGSWVVGFFRDGETAQDPIIMGSLPSMSTSVDYGFGFTDPNQQYPYGDKVDQVDGPEESLQTAAPNFKDSYTYIKKEEYRAKLDPIPIALNGTWELPPLPQIIDVKYPKNHVRAYERKLDIAPVADGGGKPTGILEQGPNEFKGGIGEVKPKTMHVEEFDVTPDFERISRMHKTGTYSEWTNEGNETVVVVGKEYRIICKDSYINIKGNAHVTFDNDVRMLIEGNQYVHLRGNRYEFIEGDVEQHVKGKVTQYYESDFDFDLEGNKYETVGGNVDEDYGGNQKTYIASTLNLESNGNMYLRAPRIDLNDAGPASPIAPVPIDLGDSPAIVPAVDLVERE
jgi:hypothetical protein